ncbi:MAG: hypothetical protein HKN32_06805 [Flavobacteriales bacterium]|nr:hypothetical protein [Flavobacteriales bacterium]
MKIIDNISSLLGDDLKASIHPKTRLMIAASCFSIYAYEALKSELSKIDSLEFIFIVPTFVPNEASEELRNHIYVYVITDLEVERDFVKELDTSTEVVVYTKLPRGFLIPTPVGDYNPDWAITFKDGSVKHINFVAETRGSVSTMELRALGDTKIECARIFIDEINRKIDPKYVNYDVVTSYGKVMEIVGRTNY